MWLDTWRSCECCLQSCEFTWDLILLIYRALFSCPPSSLAFPLFLPPLLRISWPLRKVFCWIQSLGCITNQGCSRTPGSKARVWRCSVCVCQAVQGLCKETMQTTSYFLNSLGQTTEPLKNTKYYYHSSCFYFCSVFCLCLLCHCVFWLGPIEEKYLVCLFVCVFFCFCVWMGLYVLICLQVL